jgi:hypothetical protein
MTERVFLVKNSVLLTFAISASISLFMTGLARSQDLLGGKLGVISLSASQEVPLVPEKLRLLMSFKVESRDGKRALQALYDHQKSVTKTLEDLGAVPASIEFTKPVINMGVPGVDDPEAARKRLRQQSATLRNINIPGRGRTPANEETDTETELPIVFTAASKVIAEWALTKEAEEANLLLPSTIKTSIEQNDLRGRNLKVVLNEDEQKLIAPLTAINSYSSERVAPDVLMLYVGIVSESQEEMAIKEAYNKATKHAGSLAKVMGKKISAVRSISMSPINPSSVARSFEYSANGQMVLSHLRKDPRESFSEEASLLKHVLSLSLQFETE